MCQFLNVLEPGSFGGAGVGRWQAGNLFAEILSNLEQQAGGLNDLLLA